MVVIIIIAAAAAAAAFSITFVSIAVGISSCRPCHGLNETAIYSSIVPLFLKQSLRDRRIPKNNVCMHG